MITYLSKSMGSPKRFYKKLQDKNFDKIDRYDVSLKQNLSDIKCHVRFYFHLATFR